MQPDLCVVCDLSKLDDKGNIGAPHLIIETIPTENSKREMTLKFELYQKNKLKEYWIVNRSDKTILVCVLNNDKFTGLKP